MRLLVFIAIFFLANCAGCNRKATRVIESENSEVIEAIEKNSILWGVEKVLLNEDNSVTLVDSKHSGTGVNFLMSDSSNEIVDSASLKVGQTCTLMDRRHMFITYELKDIKDDKLTFMVTDKFIGISFGDDIKIARKMITILPYTNKF